MILSDREYLQVNQALFSVVNAYHARAATEPSAGPEPLTVSERAVILVLGQMAPINLRHLAECMHVSPGPVSQYVQRLVAKNLIEKEQDHIDRRNWWLRLSPAGQNAYAETIEGAASYTRDFLEVLDTSEQHTLHDLLLKISHRLGYDWF